ncbi:hypothetical protein SRB5_17340 [Streptomyces sp. RB5]|uniref:SGNH hydrolase-type esterase domain-containing protein n=1 Tax=Streptomyces smaragdinus TaxID=2585196 RepID=A0A7K0CDS5_9ACTN|nr:SGNH/GDSL hydrolase family protein [Streptomyces smaragdinus]MQY11615.1 hypothetical protein [Streptomyces smaragdinus]
MTAIAQSDHESLALRHRGGVLLERYGIDLHLHPYVGFSLARNHRSDMINTDAEGFRHSTSRFGTVDSRSWLDAGGGGLVVGNSTAFGMASGSDDATLPSQLARISGRRELNAAVVGGNSLQELVAALPFVRAARTIVVFSGANDYWSMLASRTPDSVFGPVFFEGTMASLIRTPMFDLAATVAGDTPPLPPVVEGEVPPPPDFADATERIEAAANRQLANLEHLSALTDDRIRLLFCLQPFAAPSTRDITPEEQANFDFREPVFGRPENSVFETHWGAYGRLVEAGCRKLGVPFTDISADRFRGFAFNDHLHLTDEGSRQAARMVHTALEELT